VNYSVSESKGAKDLYNFFCASIHGWKWSVSVNRLHHFTCKTPSCLATLEKFPWCDHHKFHLILYDYFAGVDNKWDLIYSTIHVRRVVLSKDEIGRCGRWICKNSDHLGKNADIHGLICTSVLTIGSSFVGSHCWGGSITTIRCDRCWCLVQNRDIVIRSPFCCIFVVEWGIRNGSTDFGVICKDLRTHLLLFYYIQSPVRSV
jgi:hypothetical protein